MSLAPSDQSQLILPLFEGIFEAPVWDRFLHGLQRRTGALRVWLMTGHGTAPPGTGLIRRIAPSAAAGLERHDSLALDALSLSALRPNRTYTLDELLDFDDTARRSAQDAALLAAGIGDGRFLRVTGRSGMMMQLALLHIRRSFEAADSAVLTALAPAIASALDLHDAVARLHVRAQAAEHSLALLGVGQAVLDADGSMIVCDPQAREAAPALCGHDMKRRAADDAVRQACAALVGAGPQERRMVRLDPAGERHALLRPLLPSDASLMHSAVAIASVRFERGGDGNAAARALQAGTSLSRKEADLAVAISRGQSVADAAQALGLTLETARNYTKRIYSKLALTGQADLTRYVLNSLAPLG
jgi:DNA-binding CsgD family transcriptional regulator